MEFIKKCWAAIVDFAKTAWSAIVAFAQKCYAYAMENPKLGLIIAGGAALVLILLIVIIVRSSKKKRAKKEAEKQPQRRRMTFEEKHARDLKIAALAREQKAAEDKQKHEQAWKEVEAKLAAQAKAAQEETAQEPAPAPVVETVETPVVETVQEEKEVKEEIAVANAAEPAPAPVVETVETPVAVKAEETEKAPELFEELKDAEEEDEIWYDENETDIAARYSGKWLICRMITEDSSEDEMFFFELHASNGEKLLSSEEYTTYAGAVRGIATHKTNIAKGNFKIAVSKKGDYIFKLLSGKNLLLCMGENYPTRARCEKAIESTKRFAATAVIDENVQDYVVKVPAEDTAEIAPTPAKGKGKWIISAQKDANGEQVFFFELYANNGEKLLSSEEYTTYIGAVNGIATHKANIQKDNFRITLTKRGDYIYKLLNGNGQLLCLGEHYKTKRLCQNAVESVKRFALTSPMLTEAKMLD